MSTPNFSFSNTNNVYVIDEIDDFTVIDLRERVENLLENDKSIFIRGIYEADGDRYYPALFFSELNHEFEFCGLSFCVSAEIGIRAGYYRGNNLDFNIKVTWENAVGWVSPYEYNRNSHSYYDYESPYELGKELAKEVDDGYYLEQLGVSRGLFVMNKERFAKRVAAEIDDMIEKADNICKQLCESEYACVGVFSNGEAVYEAV